MTYKDPTGIFYIARQMGDRIPVNGLLHLYVIAILGSYNSETNEYVINTLMNLKQGTDVLDEKYHEKSGRALIIDQSIF